MKRTIWWRSLTFATGAMLAGSLVVATAGTASAARKPGDPTPLSEAKAASAKPVPVKPFQADVTATRALHGAQKVAWPTAGVTDVDFAAAKLQAKQTETAGNLPVRLAPVHIGLRSRRRATGQGAHRSSRPETRRSGGNARNHGAAQPRGRGEQGGTGHRRPRLLGLPRCVRRRLGVPAPGRVAASVCGHHPVPAGMSHQEAVGDPQRHHGRTGFGPGGRRTQRVGVRTRGRSRRTDR